MVLKELSCTISTVGVYCVLERTDLQQFLLWDYVVVLKELIFNNI